MLRTALELLPTDGEADRIWPTRLLTLQTANSTSRIVNLITTITTNDESGAILAGDDKAVDLVSLETHEAFHNATIPSDLFKGLSSLTICFRVFFLPLLFQEAWFWSRVTCIIHGVNIRFSLVQLMPTPQPPLSLNKKKKAIRRILPLFSRNDMTKNLDVSSYSSPSLGSTVRPLLVFFSSSSYPLHDAQHAKYWLSLSSPLFFPILLLSSDSSLVLKGRQDGWCPIFIFMTHNKKLNAVGGEGVFLYLSWME
jgi:hypothetical protein